MSKEIRVAVLSAVCVLALGTSLSSTASPLTMSTAVIASTEPTQIMNNIELVLQYKKQIEQTINQVKQYEAQLKSLRQMDRGRLDGMLKGVGGSMTADEIMRTLNEVSEVDARLGTLNESMATITREGRIAGDTLALLRSKGRDVSPSDYVGMMKALGEINQDTYGERLRALDRAGTNAQNDIRRVQAIAEMSPNIQTHVEGFGALVQTNAIMSGQLAGMQQSMNSATAMNVQTAQLLAKESNRADVDEVRNQTWVRNAIAPAGGSGE